MHLVQKICEIAFHHPRRTGSAEITKNKFKAPYIATESEVDGFRLLTIEGEQCNGHHLYYFHGGGYIVEPGWMHRDTIKKFVDYGFRITYVDYPMAPEYTAEVTNRVIIKGYEQITKKYSKDEFHIAGDSAGGGLALSFLMMLRDYNISPMPKSSVLISPWLDLTMSNPDIKDYMKGEKVLPYDGLIYAGQLYAGSMDPKSPYVSPIYGQFNDLGRLIMFYSAKEMFVPDCEKLVSLMDGAKNSSIKPIKDKGGFHDYVTYVFLKSAKYAFQETHKFLLEEEDEVLVQGNIVMQELFD